jgi:hypothetical protein
MGPSVEMAGSNTQECALFVELVNEIKDIAR